MRFDLVDLQLFIAVAETRSITNGAAKVHLALASASERIKGLEEALGVSLLRRGRRGVELTPAGESLLDHARVVIHNVETMRGDLLAYASGARATVRFLANTSGIAYGERQLTAIDFSSLNADQKRAALVEANADRCTCGCGMTLAQCVATDMTCPVRQDNITKIRGMVQRALASGGGS